MKPKSKGKGSKLSAILAGPCRDQLLKMQEVEGMTFKDPLILQAIHQAKMERIQNTNNASQHPTSSKLCDQPKKQVKNRKTKSKYIHVYTIYFL